ncbi:MAG: sigma factor [Thermoanaerobaculia bacterium]|nr:sigma factor [Thermoanaerobaculia bacterium]
MLPLIRRVADFVGRQCGLSAEDREDLASDVCLKLIENDYEKLRQFEGRAKLTTYLKTVVTREATDLFRHKHGKLRPAARSRERGEWACRYERLRRNEGRSREEALAILEREGFHVPLDQLDALDAEIAARTPPRSFETTDGLRELPAPGADPEQAVLAKERHMRRRQLRLALRRAVYELPQEDRVFLKLYCEPNARQRAKRLALMFGRSPPEVYRHFFDLCKDLKRRLERLGFDVDEVKALLAEIWDEEENL